jgi:hypothetical protein
MRWARNAFAASFVSSADHRFVVSTRSLGTYREERGREGRDKNMRYAKNAFAASLVSLADQRLVVSTRSLGTYN